MTQEEILAIASFYDSTLRFVLPLMSDYFATQKVSGPNPLKPVSTTQSVNPTIPVLLVWKTEESPRLREHLKGMPLPANLRDSEAMTIAVQDLGKKETSIVVAFDFVKISDTAHEKLGDTAGFQMVLIANIIHELLGHLPFELTGESLTRSNDCNEERAILRTIDFLAWFVKKSKEARPRRTPGTGTNPTVQQAEKMLAHWKNALERHRRKNRTRRQPRPSSP